jgi:hypothetical protein
MPSPVGFAPLDPPLPPADFGFAKVLGPTRGGVRSEGRGIRAGSPPSFRFNAGWRGWALVKGAEGLSSYGSGVSVSLNFSALVLSRV